MKRLFIALFLFACSSSDNGVENLSTNSIELILDETGKMVMAVSERQVRLGWTETLIRGLHAGGYYPFVDSLYSKYYHRVIKTKTTSRDTVLPQGMTFVQHQVALGWTPSMGNKIRAFDIPKLKIQDNLAQAWTDVLNTTIADSVRNDEVEDVPEYNRFMDWGKLGRKEFIIMRFEGLTQAQVDSHLAEIDTIVVIDGQPDTTRRIPRLGMTVTFLRDSVIVLGKSLKDLTLRDLAQSGQIPQRIKTYFQNNVIGRGGITLDTTVWALLRDHRGKIPFLWMRHPKFRQAIKRKWLKRL